jgi:hypothetical protein
MPDRDLEPTLVEKTTIPGEPESEVEASPRRAVPGNLWAGLGGPPADAGNTLRRATNGRLSRAGSALLNLQNQYGNRYVQRLINPRQRLTVQPKLMLGDVDTPLEQEAEQASRTISSGRPLSASPTPVSGPVMPVTSDTESAINQVRGSGQPLPENTQAQMGQALNTDLSGVRVHTDHRADSLNQSLQAKAFTTGQDIFFRRGTYNPGSSHGQQLLAHELTHVAQQNQGDSIIQRTFYKEVSGVRTTVASNEAKKYLRAQARHIPASVIDKLIEDYDGPNKPSIKLTDLAYEAFQRANEYLGNFSEQHPSTQSLNFPPPPPNRPLPPPRRDLRPLPPRPKVVNDQVEVKEEKFDNTAINKKKPKSKFGGFEALFGNRKKQSEEVRRMLEESEQKAVYGESTASHLEQARQKRATKLYDEVKEGTYEYVVSYLWESLEPNDQKDLFSQLYQEEKDEVIPIIPQANEEKKGVILALAKKALVPYGQPTQVRGLETGLYKNKITTLGMDNNNKKVAIGFHGTLGEPKDVLKSKKEKGWGGLTQTIGVPYFQKRYALNEPWNPLKSYLNNIGPSARLGMNKDNELLTTVSLATEPQAAIKFPFRQENKEEVTGYLYATVFDEAYPTAKHQKSDAFPEIAVKEVKPENIVGYVQVNKDYNPNRIREVATKNNFNSPTPSLEMKEMKNENFIYKTSDFIENPPFKQKWPNNKNKIIEKVKNELADNVGLDETRHYYELKIYH